MVGDRHPLVVRQQRVVGPEQPADRRGVMDRGVEVGEVADVGGDAVLGRRLRHQQRPQARRQGGPGCAAPATAPRAARRWPRGRAPMNAFSVGCAHAASASAARVPRTAPSACSAPEIENLIADGHAATEALARCRRGGSSPNGRFCSGKSAARRRSASLPSCGSAGSWVSSSWRHRCRRSPRGAAARGAPGVRRGVALRVGGR